MLIKQELEWLLNQLAKTNKTHVVVDGVEITIKLVEDASRLSFSTLIWKGDDYIPKSVRQFASQPPPFPKGDLPTFVKVDEQHTAVFLSFFCQVDEVTWPILSDLLEDFSREAHEWRYLLEERDRDDLVPVRVK